MSMENKWLKEWYNLDKWAKGGEKRITGTKQVTETDTRISHLGPARPDPNIKVL